MLKKRPTKHDVLAFANVIAKISIEAVLNKITMPQFEDKLLELVNDFLRKFGK